jgi:hypothetical protein
MLVAVSAATGVLVMVMLVDDVQLSRVLTARGVKTVGTFDQMRCGKGCSSLPVRFRTQDGRTVVADVTAFLEPDDDTIVIRYDPRHPTHAQPANGVVVDETINLIFGLLLCGGSLCWVRYHTNLLPSRRRRGGETAALGSGEADDTTGHVRVLL